MHRKARIAIVDDHPMVRKGLISAFSEAGDFDVIGEGASAQDAIDIARSSNPDVALLDVSMPGDGIEAARLIHAEMPGIAVVLFSIRDDLATVRSAFKAGAKGFISKGVDAVELTSAIRRVVSGERYVTPDLAAKLISGEDQTTSDPHPGTKLNPRELQILQLLETGLSNSEIAESLDLSENTVKHYMKLILQKLGARNRTEAALLARRHAAISDASA